MDWVIQTFDPWLESRARSNLLIIGGLSLVAIIAAGIGIATTRTILPYDQIKAVIQPVIQPVINQVSNFQSPSGTTATFACAKDKSIKATFHQGSSAPAAPAPGEPPRPTGSVHLVLSDGRSLTLPQTISADGARYANPDESFIFWNVGNTAFIEENGKQTYSDCVTKS